MWPLQQVSQTLWLLSQVWQTKDTLDPLFPLFPRKIILFFCQNQIQKKTCYWTPPKKYIHSVWKSPKMSHLNFGIFHPFLSYLKLTCLVTLFDRKLQVFKKSPKWTIFGIFNELLSTQNVNVARFARNAKCDFFCDFQTFWHTLDFNLNCCPLKMLT